MKGNNLVDMNIFIPIGQDCEVAHYLRRKKLRSQAFPFDWNCASLEMVLNVLSSDFEGFLDDIYIGKKIRRMYFEDNGVDIKILNEFIYPIIDKKYGILFPHDYDNIDDNTLAKVKDKYNRRIQRYRETINNTELAIYLVYGNPHGELNTWQVSCYKEYDPSLLKLYGE